MSVLDSQPSKHLSFLLTEASETEAFGAALWAALPEKALVFLHGELGAGKTTLIRGLLRAAGYQQTVKSPTYSLVEEYQINNRYIYHFDLYRLKDAEELAWIGMDDYLQQNALCLIEWPEMGFGYLTEPDFSITIHYQNEARLIEVSDLQSDEKNKLQLHWKNKDILI